MSKYLRGENPDDQPPAEDTGPDVDRRRVFFQRPGNHLRWKATGDAIVYIGEQSQETTHIWFAWPDCRDMLR